MSIIYLDHAASSWPKPPEVIQAMTSCIEETGANPGRGSHSMAVKASRILFEGRSLLARLFGIDNPIDVVFTSNATASLNLAIKGFVREKDHVICTPMEHNSVRRPLEYLRKEKKIELTYLQADEKGEICLDEAVRAFRSNTTLFVCSHSSNLLGTIQPIDKFAEMCRRNGVKLLVDAAQTAGTVPIDVQTMGIDMLAFPGHKGLLGPQGTGGLYISSEIELEPILHGGTGSRSEDIDQPSVRPDRYEAGTPNTVGVAGLSAAVKLIVRETVEAIHTKEWTLTQQMMQGLLEIPGVRLLGPDLGVDKTGIVSFVLEGADSSEIAFQLDRNYQIAVRSGFHCTPLGHQTAGTTTTGAVRASVGYYSTADQVNYLIQAMKEISQSYK
ncbi:aminotransferase class V-fold PLP-dependent enzyme [Paenibacillus sp. J2TS4]|uniref:aminotransferase class V-fold PLP-dependent enzyme n=1 Tax=Paenibacillus sp. J2TS4 TaxID=2807194 RepID=UPI001B0E8732|nr:aminotransferase class V-fold PLP-dependent enzyme [Paenibacillus sp. J2TS4]GIP36018.1 cysteine desulfurase [Paenibacillus sp. J2TS4]